MSSNWRKGTVCKFWIKGICRYGEECRYAHTGHYCKYCKKTGHKIETCQKLAKKKISLKKKIPTCNKCNSYNHDSRECILTYCEKCGYTTHIIDNCPEVKHGRRHKKIIDCLNKEGFYLSVTCKVSERTWNGYPSCGEYEYNTSIYTEHYDIPYFLKLEDIDYDGHIISGGVYSEYGNDEITNILYYGQEERKKRELILVTIENSKIHDFEHEQKIYNSIKNIFDEYEESSSEENTH